MAAAVCLFGCGGAGQVVRSSANDCSWEELSAISHEIAAAPDEAASRAIAQKYHLAGADGTQAKDVVLSDATATRAVVAGIRQDARPDGSPVGLTFMLADAVGPRAMNNDAGHTEILGEAAGSSGTMGGWASSELRNWLNGDFAAELPADLQNALAGIAKKSTAVPRSETVMTDDFALADAAGALIETTTDQLWVPAVSEMAGVSDDTYSAELDSSAGWRDVLRAEGAQYLLFADAGVREEEPSELLAMHLAAPGGAGADGGMGADGGAGAGAATAWWLRTVEDGYFYDVSADGVLDRSESEIPSGEPQGVVVFFCV